MENNEENLTSQEPETTPVVEPTPQATEPVAEKNVEPAEPTSTEEPQKTSKEPNTRLVGIVAVVAVAAIAILLIIFAFFTRSPKSAVKDYIKYFNKANAKKVMALVDYEGTTAFDNISSYSILTGDYTYDFESFEDEYEDIIDQVKDMDKDEKEAYKEAKEDLVDDLQDILDAFKETGIKISVKKVTTEKVDDCKKLTKVTATIEVKLDGEKEEGEITFYTMKKGLKNYIVYSDFN